VNFDHDNPYPSTRHPVFARNVVATSHPLAAQAGLAMLARGGNAVDAAIAAAAAMTIVEPVSNGLGSDAFAIVWDGARLQGLNASGHAPAAWTPHYFAGLHAASADSNRPPPRGWNSVTVPGAVAAWAALHERFGSLPFDALLAPAIDIAARGCALPPIVAGKWAAAVPLLHGQPGFAQAFMPGGRAPRMGELWRFPDAARGLERIAATRGEAFYRGDVAAAIVAHAKAHGGAMTEDDLASFRPQWVEPIGRAVAGHVLHELPPNGQGLTALIALGILEHFDLASLDPDGVDAIHLQIEAIKLAFADVYAHVAEPSAMRVTPEALLDDAYLAARAKLVDVRRAQVQTTGQPARGGTIYLSTADERGMMVSFIQSNFMGFGSGVVVPGYGISMQNRGHGFVLDAASANVVAPRKRPFHTIIPAFLTKDGQSVMSFGVMGAHMQPQGHVQTLLRMLLWKQHPQAACDAPRWRANDGLSVNVERHLPAQTKAGLAARGHEIAELNDWYNDFGAGQFIWRLGDPAAEGYVAASDSRRDGLAAGF
jgi:gamma-glutamyltranspeptidase / glutathione hydrolase